MGQRSHSPIVLNRTVVDQVDLIQLKYPQNTVVPIVTNKDLPKDLNITTQKKLEVKNAWLYCKLGTSMLSLIISNKSRAMVVVIIW